MPHLSTTIRSAGVDTLTCSAALREDGNPLLDMAYQLMLDEVAHKSKLSRFQRAVFRGYQSTHVGWGVSRGRLLVELRGNAAYQHALTAISMAEKVSRLDVQVSVFQHPYDHDMALNIYLGAREKAAQRGRPSTFRMQGESDGGTTLYVGSGASRYQARLYERFYKSHDKAEKDVWRYEVQTRRERAMQMAGILQQSPDAIPTIQGAVHGHFARRGVVPIFDPQAEVRVEALPESETDRERSLRWLGSSVAPALDRHRKWGSYQEAMQALGIYRTGEAQ